MVIKENPNANYLAHFRIRGSKNGLRRFQSYAVAPTRSGMVGQEVGEAAAQRARIERSSDVMPDRNKIRKEAEQNYREQKEAAKQQERIRIAKEKEAANKKEWAKSYKDLEKHADSFSNKELEDAVTRLELMDKIKDRRLGRAETTTLKGANTLKNLSSGATAILGVYNALAAGLNAYNKYNQTGRTPLPRAGWDNQNQQQKKKNAKHSALSADHLEHWGILGQKKGLRRFQSYKVAPTRSGMVGQEVGEAAEQAARVGSGTEDEAKSGIELAAANAKTLSDNGFTESTPAWYS